MKPHTITVHVQGEEDNRARVRSMVIAIDAATAVMEANALAELKPIGDADAPGAREYHAATVRAVASDLAKPLRDALDRFEAVATRKRRALGLPV
jgi:hypothetical protein